MSTSFLQNQKMRAGLIAARQLPRLSFRKVSSFTFILLLTIMRLALSDIFMREFQSKPWTTPVYHQLTQYGTLLKPLFLWYARLGSHETSTYSTLGCAILHRPRRRFDTNCLVLDVPLHQDLCYA